MKLYDPEKLVTFPWFIQPKLNGVYAELGTDGLFRSKTGKYFPAIQATWRSDAYSTDVPIRGEFYFPGWSLQEILSAVTPDKPNQGSHVLRYFAYDCGELNIPQCERIKTLQELYYVGSYYDRFFIVPTYRINSQADGSAHYKLFLREGYEGAVYRPYYFGELLKRKPFKDAEFLCTGVVEGVGKRKGHVGKFVLTTADGKVFHSGGGRVSYAKLAEYLVNPPVGKMITVRYQHTSDDGIPLCAQFISVRDYE